MQVAIDSTGCPGTKEQWLITTCKGVFVDINDFKEEDVDIEVIAHALSLNCRYNGHCKYHYSVAKHSVLVHDCLQREYGAPCRLAFAGLLHDASEAYIQDVVRGIKVRFPPYIEVEQHIQDVIFRKFGLPEYAEYHDQIKVWDNRVLKAEVNALMEGGGANWGEKYQKLVPADVVIAPMNPAVVKLEFLMRAKTYEQCIEKHGW